MTVDHAVAEVTAGSVRKVEFREQHDVRKDVTSDRCVYNGSHIRYSMVHRCIYNTILP